MLPLKKTYFTIFDGYLGPGKVPEARSPSKVEFSGNLHFSLRYDKIGLILESNSFENTFKKHS